MRYLEKNYGFPLADIVSLDEIEHLLTPERDREVCERDDSKLVFEMKELFEDIAVLRNAGVAAVDRWWESYMPLDLNAPEQAQMLVHFHWERAQRIYAELVEKNFAAIAGELLFYCALPVRYAVSLSPSKFHGISSFRSWVPVATWDQAGADVEVAAVRRPLDIEGTFDCAREAFTRLRRNGVGSLTIAQGAAPKFERFMSEFFAEESPTLSDAMAMLKSDLKRLVGRRWH